MIPIFQTFYLLNISSYISSLDPKLTYSKHIQNTTQKAKQTILIMKALTTTHWGMSKETLNIKYKTITRPILEYASTIWSPIISNTNRNKLQTIQKSGFRTITGCTLDTNHLHTEIKILPHRHTHETSRITPCRISWGGAWSGDGGGGRSRVGSPWGQQLQQHNCISNFTTIILVENSEDYSSKIN